MCSRTHASTQGSRLTQESAHTGVAEPHLFLVLFREREAGARLGPLSLVLRNQRNMIYSYA